MSERMTTEQDVRVFRLVRSLERLTTLEGFFQVLEESDKLDEIKLLPFEPRILLTVTGDPHLG